MRVLHAPKSHVVPSGNAQVTPSSGALSGQPKGLLTPASSPSDGVFAWPGSSEELELPQAIAAAHAHNRAAVARAASTIREAPDEVSIQRRIEL